MTWVAGFEGGEAGKLAEKDLMYGMRQLRLIHSITVFLTTGRIELQGFPQDRRDNQTQEETTDHQKRPQL